MEEDKYEIFYQYDANHLFHLLSKERKGNISAILLMVHLTQYQGISLLSSIKAAYSDFVDLLHLIK